MVTNASWEDFWLNEGHTTYLEALVLEAMYGSDYRELHIELGYGELQACIIRLHRELKLKTEPVCD
ncbi:unnamed protein product [Dibothriocephalus latus]|uniref:Peptidase M1 membrane alanine aminopeptidase domain-containing protein n=1 Tax=Dibothriocephalus latus TaxID=60516 RepID=A0A3P7PA66_DIBLA|nr:unnamed protein product [Dibothriocephalus latus]